MKIELDIESKDFEILARALESSTLKDEFPAPRIKELQIKVHTAWDSLLRKNLKD